LGPALELFSRFAWVEKVSGDRVSLGEYLEQVWAAVSREALAMIFDGADAGGLEADARLTAMWLWTLESGARDAAQSASGKPGRDKGGTKSAPSSGFLLEFDAARKIAQGLGARLDELSSIVEVKGGVARLRSVAERGSTLLGDAGGTLEVNADEQGAQMVLLDEKEEAGIRDDTGIPEPGATTLDRVHQAMLLFAAPRGDSLRRFLVDRGVGRQAMFWRLGQSLAALYPAGSPEKRWVEGVLARKKGLGFG
jgi:hypothetical protein